MERQRTEQIQIYTGLEGAYEREVERLKGDGLLSDVDKELILKFHNNLFVKGCCKERIKKVSRQLRKCCLALKLELGIDKNLNELIKEDLEKLLVYYINHPRYTYRSKEDYKAVIKQFFRWFKKEDHRLDDNNERVRLLSRRFYEYLEEDVKPNIAPKQIDFKQILTDEDIEKVIKHGCEGKIMIQTFIRLLHLSGMRSGEILRLTLSDIKVKEKLVEIHVPVEGKTGARVIFIPIFRQLIEYLDQHPFKNNLSAYLWYIGNFETEIVRKYQNSARRKVIGVEFRPLKHENIRKIIKKCFERADVNKKCNLHWFRHSRASLLAPKLTTPMMCSFFGWTLDSRQIKTYIHLSKKQLEDVILELHGLKKENEETKPIGCKVCKSVNDPKEQYCFKCLRPLRIETVIQEQELKDNEINNTVKIMMEFFSNQDNVKIWKEFLEKTQRGGIENGN